MDCFIFSHRFGKKKKIDGPSKHSGVPVASVRNNNQKNKSSPGNLHVRLIKYSHIRLGIPAAFVPFENKATLGRHLVYLPQIG